MQYEAAVEVPSFSMSGLSERGGLSTWVFFFFPRQTVMIEMGMGPTLKGALMSSAAVLLGPVGVLALAGQRWGPKVDTHDLEASCRKLSAQAKCVITVANEDIRRVHLHLRGASSHELSVSLENGGVTSYRLMNRADGPGSIKALTQHFGSRLKISKTSVFTFLERRVPFLLKY